MICDYAHKSNLLKLSHSEIKDWLKLYDNNIDIDTIKVRDVNCCGQKYITYIANENDNLCQYVIVRGTKNWKNIKTSLQYKVSYSDDFEMYLHSGYGSASMAVLRDFEQFIHPNAKLNFSGHSYGAVICCCIASSLQKKGIADINQIITFGMPQFTADPLTMNYICNELPLVQVQHIYDEIAKFDWNRLISKRRNKQMNGDDDNMQKDSNDNIVYVGSLDDFNGPIKKPKFVHRMGDYIKSIEKHVEIGQGVCV